MTSYPVTGFTPSQSMTDARAWRIAMEQYFGERQSLGNVIQTETEAFLVSVWVDYAEGFDMAETIESNSDSHGGRTPETWIGDTIGQAVTYGDCNKEADDVANNFDFDSIAPIEF